MGASSNRTLRAKRSPSWSVRVLEMLGGIALVATALFALSPTTSDAKPIAGHARIVFTSDRNVGMALYTMAADGSDVRPLTPAHPNGGAPSFSPDGRLIAFEATNGLTSACGIWLMNAEGGRLRAVLNWREDLNTTGPPTWAPNGKRLAFERDEHVWVVGIDGAGARSLAMGDNPTWSPDGRVIAFTRGFSIWLMNADGSGQRRLHSFANGTYPDAAWSPDGKCLVVAAKPPDSDNADLFLISADGSLIRRLTATQNMNEYYPAWSPSRLIAFSGSGGTYVIGPGGGRPRLVIKKGYNASWGPKGKQLVFDDTKGSSIYVATGIGTGTRLLLAGNDDEDPAWSPDHSTVAFSRNDVLELVKPDGTKMISLHIVDVGVSWSPDGNRLAAATYDDGLAILSRSESVLRRVQLPFPSSDDGPPYVTDPAWSPDGKSILCVGEQQDETFGATNIYLVPASGGRPRILVPQSQSDPLSALQSPEWSPDGARIAFVSGQAIYVASSNGTHRRMIFASSHPINRIAWSPDGTSIVFDNGEPDGPGHISIIKATGGVPRRLTDKSSSNWGPDW
jgi:Tol biopolymer transport system component